MQVQFKWQICEFGGKQTPKHCTEVYKTLKQVVKSRKGLTFLPSVLVLWTLDGITRACKDLCFHPAALCDVFVLHMRICKKLIRNPVTEKSASSRRNLLGEIWFLITVTFKKRADRRKPTVTRLLKNIKTRKLFFVFSESINDQHFRAITKSQRERVSSHLPVFGDGVPNADLPGVTGGDQLVTNEEEGLHRHVQTEDACRRKI